MQLHYTLTCNIILDYWFDYSPNKFKNFGFPFLYNIVILFYGFAVFSEKSGNVSSIQQDLTMIKNIAVPQTLSNFPDVN